MKLYLYCSYANSRRGFVLAELQEKELAPVSLSGSEDPGEQIVDRFFTYDAFRILWQEFPKSSGIPVFPQSGGGMFGIRGLRGTISDRAGVVNFALLADKEERERLEGLALGILSDPEGFALSLCGCLSIGGPCGYQAEGARLWELLDSIHPEAVPERLQAYRDGLGQRMYTVREMLRLAVYVGSWEQAAQYLYPQWIWKARPKQAFSQEEIAVLLGKNLWQ